MINETFRHFNINEWIFASDKTNTLFGSMSADELLTYQLDVKVIDWRQYLYIYNYGIQKYILKENVDPPGVPEITNLFSLWDA
jgi:fatty acyl-CoA reductase